MHIDDWITFAIVLAALAYAVWYFMSKKRSKPCCPKDCARDCKLKDRQ
ncbi:MAG: FeoB-associated Cys-rich membrane protein [Candidatus Omnitrophica bacterium]|nr:FeoB-associated Cys-rich membrane protein [Candidatus Omnitrophota bacterium]